MVALAAVDRRISTSGNRLYLSITTNNISPDGNGPRKSIFTVCHGVGGNCVGCNGAGGFGSPTSWQGKQELINTRFNTFQKRIPRVPRIFCSSLELKNFDQKPNRDGRRWSVYIKVCSHFHQRYSLFVALIVRSIRK